MGPEIPEPVAPAIEKKEEPQPAPAIIAEVPAPIMTYTEKVEEQPVVKPSVTASPFLSRPQNIYAAEIQHHVIKTTLPPVEKVPEPKVEIKSQPVPEPEPKIMFREEQEDETVFKFVVKEEPTNIAAQPKFISEAELNNEPLNEEEEQKKRAAERINKLRNLSFNMNSAEANGEYDNVPAYVRRNMELFGNTLTSVEQFYSKYTVKKDENDETQISTINTFLDGKKPD